MGAQPRLSTKRLDFQWLTGQSKTLTLTAREPPPDEDTGAVQPAIDLTGYTIVMRCRTTNPEKRDNDLEPIAFELTSDNINEIEIQDQLVEATKGQLKIRVKSDVTRYLRPGCYTYTVEMTDLLGETTPLLVGEIYFEART